MTKKDNVGNNYIVTFGFNGDEGFQVVKSKPIFAKSSEEAEIILKDQFESYEGTSCEIFSTEKQYSGGGDIKNEPNIGDLITNFGKYGSSIIEIDEKFVYWLDNYASKNHCEKSNLVLNNLDDDGDDDGYYEGERNNWICKKQYAGGGEMFKDNSQDKIVKGVEITTTISEALKEIAYNPYELLNIFKKFHKKMDFIDTHFFVTPFNNSGNKFKEIGVEIGGGDFQQIIPQNISEYKLLKYLKGKYGGLDWSNFTNQPSNYAGGGELSFKDEDNNILYTIEQDSKGIWTIFSVSDDWEKRNEYPSGFESKEDAIMVAKLEAGIEKEDDPEEWFMNKFDKYATGGGLNNKIWSMSFYSTELANPRKKQSNFIRRDVIEAPSRTKAINIAKKKHNDFGTLISIKEGEQYAEGGEMCEYSKGGNVTERRYVNKDQDYEIRYAKNRTMRKGYNDNRKFAVGGEIGNQVIFSRYGERTTGRVTDKLRNGYEVATDEGTILVEPQEVISFSDAPAERKKRFGLFEGGGDIEDKFHEEVRDWVYENAPTKYHETSLDEIPRSVFTSNQLKQVDRFNDRFNSNKFAGGGGVNAGYNVFNYTDNIYATDQVFKTKALANKFIKEFRNRFANQGYYRDNRMNKINIQDIDLVVIQSDFNPLKKFAGGGEIEGKIEDLQAIIDGDFPQFAKDKAKTEIEKLKKELQADNVLKKSESYHEEGKDVYGDSFYQWNNISMEGDQNIFAYSTPKGTIIYGEDSEGEKDFSASFTTEPYYLEDAPKEDYSFNTLKESKVKAFELLRAKKLGRASKETKAEEKSEHENDEVYIEFLNKEKNFKKDKKYFKTYNDAVNFGKSEIERFKVDMVKFNDEYKETKAEIKAEENKMTGESEGERKAGMDEEKDYVEAKTKALEKSLKDKTISETQRKRDEKELALFKKAKPTTRKAPVKKAPVKSKVVGDDLKVIKFFDLTESDWNKMALNERNKLSESYKEKNKPAKADHKKLVAKLKAKKGEGNNNRASLVPFTETRRKRNESSDRKRKALPLGKRISEDGNTYYENRLNRADKNPEDKFEAGGEIKNSGWGLNLNW